MPKNGFLPPIHDVVLIIKLLDPPKIVTG